MISWNGQLSDFSLFTMKFGDLLGLLGLVITIIGAVQASKAKKAAKSAEVAAKLAVVRAVGFGNFLKVSDAIQYIEHVKRAQSQKHDRRILEDLLTIFKKIVSEIMSFSELSDLHRSKLEESLQNIGSAEKNLLNSKADPERILRTNMALFSRVHDHLLSINSDLRREQELNHVG